MLIHYFTVYVQKKIGCLDNLLHYPVRNMSGVLLHLNLTPLILH